MSPHGYGIQKALSFYGRCAWKIGTGVSRRGTSVDRRSQNRREVVCSTGLGWSLTPVTLPALSSSVAIAIGPKPSHSAPSRVKISSSLESGLLCSLRMRIHHSCVENVEPCGLYAGRNGLALLGNACPRLPARVLVGAIYPYSLGFIMPI